MSRYSKLHVIWRARTEAGRRHIVARLEKTAQGFVLQFDDEAVAAAKADGFVSLPGFASAAIQRAPYLFATFAERLPSPARPDFADLMQMWGVERTDDQMEILARSGGISAADRLEFAEYRDADDPLTTPLEFRVAGLQKRPSASADLKAGDVLRLVREPDNVADAQATMVVRLGSGQSIGYVPKQYSALIAKHLDVDTALKTEAVRKLLLPESIGAWVVRVSRSS